jgi:hypothetical protein
MDYLDPKKMKQHRTLLFTGYILVSFAIVMTGLILLQQATKGYGLDKHGDVIQNGLMFLSSQPKGAEIYLNGKLNSNKTDSRLTLPSNVYNVELRRPGYNSWRRTIVLDAAEVEHFDYPLLFPTKLTTTTLASINGTPALSTQSPDRRWLLVSSNENALNFSVYDLKNPTKAATPISLPATILSAGATQSWKISEWADDNQHVVLEHHYDDKMEYIMVDRDTPEQSVNLTTTLSITPSKLTLNNRKYDQYYVYDAATHTLQTAALKAATLTPLLDHVLAYQSYSDNTVLYVTDSGAVTGKSLVKLKVGNATYTIRSVQAAPTYVLNLATYNGVMYLACGSSGDSRSYVYRDPVAQIKDRSNHLAVPAYVFHVAHPDYLSFSTTAQYILIENGPVVSVYDFLNKHGYSYNVTGAIDAPATHVSWMDGNRLAYVSSGKLTVIDYDKTNARTLVSASASYLPAFSPDYKFVYTLTHSALAGSADSALLQTSLLSSADR